MLDWSSPDFYSEEMKVNISQHHPAICYVLIHRGVKHLAVMVQFNGIKVVANLFLL